MNRFKKRSGNAEKETDVTMTYFNGSDIKEKRFSLTGNNR